MTATTHPLLLAVAESPENWRLRGVAADWAEDEGLPYLAECLRWTAAKKKRPYRCHLMWQCRLVWTWCLHQDGLAGAKSSLPEPLYGRVCGLEAAPEFPSALDAERALYDAWERARKEGWTP